MRIRSLLTAIGLNAIPAFGWFVGDWSAGTTLVLYWLETLIGTLLLAVLIIRHRRVRPSKGHWNYHALQKQTPQTGGSSTYLTAFLVPAVRLHRCPRNFSRRTRLHGDQEQPELGSHNQRTRFARRVNRHRRLPSRRLY